MSEPRAQRAVAPTDASPSRPTHGAAIRAPGLAPDDPFILFAHATLRREAESLAANRPSSERAATPGEIHQLRVAARRLRVAFRLFARFLSSREVTRLAADLRWFAASLGDVRDLDVYAGNFKAYAQALPAEQRSELSGYELYLRRERAAARDRAKAAFASPRTDALFADLARLVSRPPSPGALRRWHALTARDAIRRSVRRSATRVRRLGNSLLQRARPAELHQLRIKTKRLRYELEFFAAVYPPLAEAAKRCKKLQDVLGAHQDAHAATARLRRYAASLRKQGKHAALPPALIELRKGQLKLARAARRSFRAEWAAFVAAIGAARRSIA